MKFFTSNWWRGTKYPDLSVFARYEAYLESVREQIPPNLLLLHAEFTLHDSRLSAIGSDITAQTLDMTLLGWDQALAVPLSYALKFTGVSKFEQKIPRALAREREFGDLGYWECEYLNPDVEVKMLFESDAQIRVVFRDFSFEQQRRET